ncbi:MAG: GNAT family N-acetyltransferase [Gemmatimonadetes bacterium]|nr:GNAT family N-acetyltransferase [Gemmatimonadota bacterium]
MHKVAVRRLPARPRKRSKSHLSATHFARAATVGDAADVALILAQFADEGQLLPRTLAEIEAAISDFVVIVDGNDRVLGCAALTEYSPSVAEVGAVAVSRAAQGRGLGSLAVRGVEAMARRRGIPELFAMSRATQFFESLGYAATSLDRFPEKVARYEALAAQGIPVTPKSCFTKRLG